MEISYLSTASIGSSTLLNRDNRRPQSKTKDIESHLSLIRDQISAVSPFSFIRTMTVGFGISPNLQTLHQLWRKRSRAYIQDGYIPPVGNYTPPRERISSIKENLEVTRKLFDTSSHDGGVFADVHYHHFAPKIPQQSAT